MDADGLLMVADGSPGGLGGVVIDCVAFSAGYKSIRQNTSKEAGEAIADDWFLF